MDEQLSRLLVTATEVAVVNVDMVIAYVAQPFAYHSLGLLFDESFIDVHSVGVPGAPTHRWAVLCRCSHAGHQEGCHPKRLRFHSGLFRNFGDSFAYAGIGLLDMQQLANGGSNVGDVHLS